MAEETETQASASKAKGEVEVLNDNTDEGTNSNSDLNGDSKQYNFHTLAKLLELVPKLTLHNYYSWSTHIKSFLQSVPHVMKHLKGAYDKKHTKWNCAFDDTLINALHGTINTISKYNVNYLILNIIREYHTFHQVWKKIETGLTNEATVTSCQLALIAQLGDIKMFNSNTQKLIQEIRSIQMESSLLGKPFANDTLFSNLQKCTICHPMYKETVTTISQLNFNALTTALIICQSAIENNPTYKVDLCQAGARIAGSDNQDESAKVDKKDEKDKKDDSHTSARVATRPRKI
ncbi:hypothetical protein NDA14_000473 [Ustilago hordei]|nr:hypothetical protein NDA10_004387 [Ustilago hordei]KAJ1573386.1 hypothetical protein NDA15_006761 [Ustilago hordei]KAJ1596196.1 hypothetical protein NDA14_000473 [Ustilago hordei]